jgi:putative ABC transport system substrate-binding protein
MISRRRLLAALGAAPLASALPSFAQPTGKIPRIGMLWHAASAVEEAPYLDALHRGLKELGYVEGKNIVLEHRYPNEEPEKFRSMAAELVALKVDVLVAAGPTASLAAKNATTNIPVVFTLAPDPLASKLVPSLRRPGGNVTGLTNFGFQLGAKRLQFLKEALPNLSRFALLVNPNVQITPQYIEETQEAAARLKVTVQPVNVRTADELEPAFDSVVKARLQAVLVMSGGGVFFGARERVAQLALARRLPTMAYSRETFDAGALMSYGPDQAAIFQRAATYIDKILKGANPGEIPVENPTKFEYLINLKVAKTLNIKIPNAVMLRADKVIE